jgi:hypothetical protein
MGTRDVAAHILAKIDGIVQSGALEDEGPAPVPPGMSAGSTTTATIQSNAVQRIKYNQAMFWEMRQTVGERRGPC